METKKISGASLIPPAINYVLFPIYVGAAKASIQTSACQPFDVIKTLIQADPKKAWGRFFNITTNTTDLNSAFQNALKKEKGSLPMVICNSRLIAGGPQNALLKWPYYSGITFAHTLSDQNNLNSEQKWLLATTFATLIINPIEAIKIQIQTKEKENNKLMQSIQHAIKTAGIQSIFIRALPSCIGRELVFNGAFHVFPEKLKEFIETNKDDSTLRLLTSGALAGIVSTPFDTIKTVQQKSLVDTIPAVKNIFMEHGITGFFNGAQYRAVMIAIAIPVLNGVSKHFGQ